LFLWVALGAFSLRSVGGGEERRGRRQVCGGGGGGIKAAGA
jgi:hypothetical protein